MVSKQEENERLLAAYDSAVVEYRRTWSNRTLPERFLEMNLARNAIIAAMQQPSPVDGELVERHDTGVWMMKGRECQSVAREIVEDVMAALGMDLHDFRRRDEAILGCSETVTKVMNAAALSTPPSPLNVSGQKPCHECPDAMSALQHGCVQEPLPLMIVNALIEANIITQKAGE